MSATFGSTIEATGDLALGDSNSYVGFFSDGELLTGTHTVTIHDRNEAVLGSLTQLGDGASVGALTAGNAAPTDTHAHFLLEQGKNMVGRGSVNGNYKNHGHVIGDGPTVERSHLDGHGHLPQAEPLSLAISSKRLIRPLLPNAHSVPPAP
ncbi:MAG: hypothetical protein QGH94_13780, partial [Phycisphaerae bacterium]|nr:hypothetical protein [Phycisphaerae bacterium]